MLSFDDYNQRIVEFYTNDEKQTSYDYGYFKVAEVATKESYIKYKLERGVFNKVL